MGVPKKRGTKSRRNRRRMHIFLKKPHLIKCPKCGHLILPHTICRSCGYYKGKEVIDVLGKLDKKERKKKEKELKLKAEEKEGKEIKKKKRSLSWKELSRK